MNDGSNNYKKGRITFWRALQKGQKLNLAPPPALSLSQWAEQYAYLSKETSAQTGRFEAYAYQVGMMDVITDPRVEKVSVMKSARVGYTKIIDHVVGYYLHQDPSPILVVQPRVEDAEDYSKSEIAPMLRDTTVLAEITLMPKEAFMPQPIVLNAANSGTVQAMAGPLLSNSSIARIPTMPFNFQNKANNNAVLSPISNKGNRSSLLLF